MVLWDDDAVYTDHKKKKEETKVHTLKVSSVNKPQGIKQIEIDPMDEECMRA